MTFRVVLTLAARRDLIDIAAFVAENNSPGQAEDLMRGILEIVEALETLPQRGRNIPELLQFGRTDMRERFFKPYRIFYRIDGSDVSILLVADGRRNLQRLLMRRLLDQ